MQAFPRLLHCAFPRLVHYLYIWSAKAGKLLGTTMSTAVKGTLVSCPDPTLPEKKGLVTIRHPAQPSDISRLACEMTNHNTVRIISFAMKSTWH